MSKTKNKTAWLIDSSIYIFKSWYTRQEEFDICGNPTHAVMGFIDFAYKLLNTERPQMIAFAFDESLATSYRRNIYPLYKANRAPAPDSLKLQFQLCRQFLRYFGLHESASKFYEADDLIGTWSQALKHKHIPATFITADKDLAQLVGEHDIWWEYERGIKHDIKLLIKKFKVRPDQIADQLAIAGDKSDNIPGVPGVGMSTAGKLLKKFEDIDNLLKNIHQISDMQIRGAKRLETLIYEHKTNILLSKQLTEIQCNIEDVDIRHFEIGKINLSKFEALAKRLKLSQQKQNLWLTLHNNLLSNPNYP